jgi:hypothetical protein
MTARIKQMESATSDDNGRAKLAAIRARARLRAARIRAKAEFEKARLDAAGQLGGSCARRA